MDAMWRTYGYQTYPASIPAVNLVKVMLEDAANKLLDKDNCCDIVVYFNRPIVLSTLKFTEMFNLYSWSYKLLKHFKNNLQLRNSEYWEIQIPKLSRKIFVMKKLNPSPSITRLGMLCILSGEIWYLRQIMVHCAIVSWVDAKTVNGVPYSTFQEGAVARGIIEHSDEAIVSFREVLPYSTPADLRGFFVMLTINGFVTLPIFKNAQYYRHLQQDFLMEQQSNQRLADQKLLRDLSHRFQVEDKTSSMYGIPEPNEHLSEIDIERSKYNAWEQSQLYNSLCDHSPNTDEQQHIFDEIADNILQGTTGLYFVQGIGGSGKSTLCKKLLAWARSQGKLCLGCASTGLAATIYENFNTAHSLFKFPVVEDQDRDEESIIECQLRKNPRRLQLLQSANLIVWDEFPSNHKELFESAYNCLDGFRNKVLVCFGDFRQIAPVVTNGCRQQIVRASIVSSYLWERYSVRTLSTNMRLLGLSSQNIENLTPEQILFLTNQRDYAEMITKIGEGKWKGNNLISQDETQGTQEITVPNVYCITNLADAIDFIYPERFNTPHFTSRLILASTNNQVDEWNHQIQELNPEISNAKELLSADILCEVDDPHGILKEILCPQVLHTFNKNNVPQHVLKLCVGDVCIIQRNLSKKDAITNNTRVRILSISKFCVHVQTLGVNPKRAAIPRIRFKFRLPFGQSYQLRRTQFPLRLAYCMSINKSQGQECDATLLDLRLPPFAHGHLYVGLSRVRNSSNVAIFTESSSLLIGSRMGTAEQGDILPITTNVIYPELLTPINITVNLAEQTNDELDNLMQHIHSDYNVDDDDFDGVTMI